MADQTKTHLWINTSIAVLAFLASGSSAYFSMQTYGLKKESLTFTARLNFDCKLQTNGDYLGICWNVAISNTSDIGAVIVAHKVFSLMQGGGLAISAGFDEVEDETGKPILIPLVLASNDSKTVVVRAPSQSNSSVIDLAKNLKAQRGKEPSIGALMEAAQAKNIDLIGNTIAPMPGVPPSGWVYINKVIDRTSLFRVTTARGNTFEATLKYPSPE